MKEERNSWIDELVDFYDFVWREGVQAHESCINDELMDDFKAGGNKFEEMKKLIIKRFPTKGEALGAFKKANK